MKRILMFLVILLAIGATAFGQSRRVSGRVLDETGQGLPGAGITVQGTTTGTVTDVEGNFELEVPEGKNTLVVQSIGYGTQNVNVTNGDLTVRLNPASRELQTVAVTALGLRREKRELGYASTTLTSDDLNNGNNVSALSALQGKTAGLNITSTTGGPGGSTRVVLRGEKSIQGNNNALIVVDGVPINNSSRSYDGELVTGRDERYQVDFGNRGNDVNPEDIESITVLKGPSAAALYGARGANGAIMITTKSGKGRKSALKNSVSYQMSYTLSDVLKLPEFQNKYGQGDLQGDANDRRENFSWGKEFDGQLKPWGQQIYGQQRVKPYSAVPDNVKNFFDRGKTTEHNVSLGGSNEGGDSYYISFNSLKNTGVIPNTFYNKYSMRFNGSATFPNKFYSNLNVNYINSHARVEMQGQAEESVYNSLLQMPRDIPITELKDLNNIFNSMGYIDTNGIERYGFFGAYMNNPYWNVANIDNRNHTDRVLGSAVIGYKPNSEWDIYNRFGVDVVADRTTLKIPKYHYLPFDEAYYNDGTDLQPREGLGGYMEDNRNNVIFYNDLIAQYKKKLSDNLNFDGLVGGNIQTNRTTVLIGNISDQTNGLVIPEYYNLQNGNGPVDNVNNLSEFRTVGIYAKAGIDFKRTIFAEVTGRNDWSSTLNPGKRSFFYPSISISYVFTETLKKSGFLENILNYGKIRASYSAVGNGALPYQSNESPGYVRTESSTGFGSIRFPFNGVPGYTFSGVIVNPDLKPEGTRSYEAGIELSFLRDRINFEGTLYNNLSFDVIQEVPTAPSSGFTAKIDNVGDIRNKGIELQLRLTPISTASGFRLEIFGTYTKNENKVEKLANDAAQTIVGGLSGMAVVYAVGKPAGSFYGIDVLTDPNGNVVVDPSTGIPLRTTSPVFLGTYQPDFVASWGTTARYKGFSFNVLFDTKQGGKFFSRTKDLMDFVGTAKETEDRKLQVWEHSVNYDEASNTYTPNTTEYDPYIWFARNISTVYGRHLVDASYVKLREASLYYNLPEKLLNRTFFGSASIGIFGNNLFIWTPKENQYADPEMSSGGNTNLQGFEFGARPSLRNYGMSLKVTF
jgi:TonB-linked SusC/RagA family outer membrane protein